MLTIRFSRIGKKNKPAYRIIISEKSKDPYGRALEILGSYNPHTKELQAKQERIKYWLSKGSGISPSVNNLLIEKEIIKGEKVKASKAGNKKKGESNPPAGGEKGGSKERAKEEKPEVKEEVKEKKPAVKEEAEDPENKKEEDKSSETKEQKDSGAEQEKSAEQKEDILKNTEAPKE
ncbi:30S ribosomal protein S16 [Patescibacteria group bacterium]|nr:30S ribosomal protein S16 [Candidatus Falkowbacteria bacterium]MBU3905964.1 30S ribosomal protein S16 [Patescibacteria group bacterium]MCG2697998.1 30S ribosomal protein S16 [Candidatus Parcubacteria bacterium]MBU4015576.1 30S ribosomal protein S16 [Patescibacteria group bacterium]MBU4027058.1 30S ribosomal protein S16 [Patescibacteria group bacterium]